MIAAAAAVAALGLPGMASAAYEHPANNEKGVIVHPEHFKSEKTRAQVIAETKAAMQRGRLSYGQSNFPIRTPDVGSSKTREQVINDVMLAAQPTKQFVTVDQVAGLALFLTTAAADEINGAALNIDGGWTAQ